MLVCERWAAELMLNYLYRECRSFRKNADHYSALMASNYYTYLISSELKKTQKLLKRRERERDRERQRETEKERDAPYSFNDRL